MHIKSLIENLVCSLNLAIYYMDQQLVCHRMYKATQKNAKINFTSQKVQSYALLGGRKLTLGLYFWISLHRVGFKTKINTVVKIK